MVSGEWCGYEYGFDAARISRSQSCKVDFRDAKTGEWYERFTSAGPDIVELLLEENNGVIAVLEDGRRMNAGILHINS